MAVDKQHQSYLRGKLHVYSNMTTPVLDLMARQLCTCTIGWLIMPSVNSHTHMGGDRELSREDSSHGTASRACDSPILIINDSYIGTRMA